MALIYLYFVLAVLIGIMAVLRGRSGGRWFIVALFATPLLAGLILMALPRRPPWEVSTAAAPDVLVAVPRPADSKIRIIRHSNNADRVAEYDILVNGVLVGAVGRNCVVDFHVPTGELLVEARSDLGGSIPLTVEAAPDRLVEIEVSKHHSSALRTFWAATFGANRYLQLTRVT